MFYIFTVTTSPLPLYRYLCNGKDGEILNF